jgi:hypothetical protein
MPNPQILGLWTWFTTQESSATQALQGLLIVIFIVSIAYAVFIHRSIAKLVVAVVMGGIALAAAANPAWIQGQVQKEQTGGLGPVHHSAPAPAALVKAPQLRGQ